MSSWKSTRAQPTYRRTYTDVRLSNTCTQHDVHNNAATSADVSGEAIGEQDGGLIRIRAIKENSKPVTYLMVGADYLTVGIVKMSLQSDDLLCSLLIAPLSRSFPLLRKLLAVSQRWLSDKGVFLVEHRAGKI